MVNLSKEKIFELIGSAIIGTVVSLIVGFGSAFMATKITLARFEEKLIFIDQTFQRHETMMTSENTKSSVAHKDLDAKTKEIQTKFEHHLNDHAMRISKLEARQDTLLRELAEIRQDIKILLRNSEERK